MGVHPLNNVMPGVRRRRRNIAADVESADAGEFSTAYATYDFTVDGGAISAIGLLAAADIPSGAIIVEAGLEVVTIPTSGGAATISLGVEAATDLLAATAIGSAPWSSLGRKNLTPLSAATSVKTTAARNITATIAAFTLTAGKFNVWARYINPTAN